MILDTIKKLLGCKDEEYLTQISQLNLIIADKSNELNELNKKIESLTQESNPPVSIGKLTNNEAYDILHPLCPTLYLSDNSYDLTSKDLGRAYTLLSKIWTQKWNQDVHDCDNFSYELAGYWSDSLKSFAFGIAWSDNHAFNFMIDEKKQVWIVEPQTSNFIKIEEAKKVTTVHYWPWRFALM